MSLGLGLPYVRSSVSGASNKSISEKKVVENHRNSGNSAKLSHFRYQNQFEVIASDVLDESSSFSNSSNLEAHKKDNSSSISVELIKTSRIDCRSPA